MEFRNKYLGELDDQENWNNNSSIIELDFRHVKRLGPSWANEVFAYFTRKHKPESILKKIKLINITKVKRAIVEKEIETGYTV